MEVIDRGGPGIARYQDGDGRQIAVQVHVGLWNEAAQELHMVEITAEEVLDLFKGKIDSAWEEFDAVIEAGRSEVSKVRDSDAGRIGALETLKAVESAPRERISYGEDCGSGK